MDWARLTINLEPELSIMAKKRAKQRRQSASAYFAALLEADLAAHPVAITPKELEVELAKIAADRIAAAKKRAAKTAHQGSGPSQKHRASLTKPASREHGHIL